MASRPRCSAWEGRRQPGAILATCLFTYLALLPGVDSRAVANVAPLEKAKAMLEDLRTQVRSEGDKEAQTYNSFACFCQTTITDKSSSVSTLTSQKDLFATSLNEQVEDRDTADSLISDAEADIRRLEGELKQLHAGRQSESLQYDREQIDLTKAITALEAAIRTLKATRTATQGSFVQLAPVARTIQAAMWMVDGLGLAAPPSRGSSSQVLSALQTLTTQPDQPPQEVYTFHADDVISTLEDLKGRFIAKKGEITDEETKSRGAHDLMVEQKTSLVQDAQNTIKTQQVAKALAQERIGSISSDLSTTAAQLLDDQKYLAEVSAECKQKAELWDQRSQVRVDELNALTAALEILKSEVVSGNSTAFIQLTALSSPVKQRMESLSRKAAEGAKRYGQHAAGSENKRREQKVEQHLALPAQHQKVNRSTAGGQLVERRNRAAALLRATARGGKSLHGALLLRAATEVEDDPFAKVKELIQALIQRLLSEAQQEANHKGWCDSETALAEQGRDQQAGTIRTLNSKLELSEAHRAKLMSLISTLADELQQNDAVLEEARTLRKQEQDENEAAIRDAKAAKEAVGQAVLALSKFYGVKPPAGVAPSFMQNLRGSGGHLAYLTSVGRSAAREMPDPGFSAEYKGLQGGAFGVLGMLEVLMNDFASTIEHVEKAETAAKQAFQELETETEASTAAKGVAHSQRSLALSAADDEDRDDRGKLVAAQALLDKKLDELDALYKACVDTSMTAEERKMRREEEIDALKQALCILDQHGVDGDYAC